MRRGHVIAVAVLSAGLTATLMASGDPSLQAPGETPNSEELTLTGCVSEGTDTGVYILSNALAKPELPNVPRAFRLISAGASLDFALHANHQVQTTGLAELKTVPDPAPGGRVDARDLPTFAVKTIQNVSERCLSGGSTATAP